LDYGTHIKKAQSSNWFTFPTFRAFNDAHHW